MINEKDEKYWKEKEAVDRIHEQQKFEMLKKLAYEMIEVIEK